MSFFDFHIYDITADREPVNMTESDLYIFVRKEDYTLETESLLGKILAAAKKNLSETPLYKVDESSLFYPLQQTPDKALFISFDVSATDMGLNCDIYPYRAFAISGKHYLFCDSLSSIASDAQKKKLLWGALKNHYQL